jgi:hypothetical protein
MLKPFSMLSLRRIKWNGFGTAISKMVVERHEGTLSASKGDPARSHLPCNIAGGVAVLSNGHDSGPSVAIGLNGSASISRQWAPASRSLRHNVGPGMVSPVTIAVVAADGSGSRSARIEMAGRGTMQ